MFEQNLSSVGGCQPLSDTANVKSRKKRAQFLGRRIDFRSPDIFWVMPRLSMEVRNLDCIGVVERKPTNAARGQHQRCGAPQAPDTNHGHRLGNNHCNRLWRQSRIESKPNSRTGPTGLVA